MKSYIKLGPIKSWIYYFH